jgi:hypothetical protein
MGAEFLEVLTFKFLMPYIECETVNAWNNQVYADHAENVYFGKTGNCRRQ